MTWSWGEPAVRALAAAAHPSQLPEAQLLAFGLKVPVVPAVGNFPQVQLRRELFTGEMRKPQVIVPRSKSIEGAPGWGVGLGQTGSVQQGSSKGARFKSCGMRANGVREEEEEGEGSPTPSVRLLPFGVITAVRLIFTWIPPTVHEPSTPSVQTTWNLTCDHSFLVTHLLRHHRSQANKDSSIIITAHTHTRLPQAPLSVFSKPFSVYLQPKSPLCLTSSVLLDV